MFKTGFIKLNKNVPKEEKSTTASNDERGVVYLGHVPHGFYENEMKQYFSQFGEVTNINIPKSKKTGKARGFAFVEFLYPEVAKVVAETMNNYLMHKKILVAKYLPPNQVKSNTFWRCNKKKIPLTIKNRSIQRKAMDRPLNSEQEEQSLSLLNKRMKRFQKKLKSKGIEYEIQTYNPVPPESKKNIKKDVSSLPEASSESDTSMVLNNDEENKALKKTVPKVTKKKEVITKGKGNKLRTKS